MLEPADNALPVADEPLAAEPAADAAEVAGDPVPDEEFDVMKFEAI